MQQTEVNVAAYAGAAGRSPYDVLATHNREYQRLLQRLSQMFATYASSAKRVADLGCGTGNITRVILESLPHANVVASDASDAMLAVLRTKVDAASRLRVVNADLLDRNAFAPASFDAINVTHAANYTGHPRQVIQNLATWLAPAGVLVITDIGRPLVVSNWTVPVLQWIREDLRDNGRGPLGAFVGSLAIGIANRPAARENERFARGQQTGRYPLHTSAEFTAWIHDAGFDVLEAEGAYRDPRTAEPLSDLVVARLRG